MNMKKLHRNLWILAGVLWTPVILATVFGEEESPAPAAVAAPAPTDYGATVYVACARAIEKMVAFPDSAEIGYSDIKHTDTHSAYAMRGKVEAKNAYGVPVSRSYLCLARKGEGDPNKASTWAAKVSWGE